MLPVLLVFSHVRWGADFQAPQQLLSRLAGRWQVLFVEAPLPGGGPHRIDVIGRAPNLQILVPRPARDGAGSRDDPMARLAGLLAAHLATHRLEVDAMWVDTPLALPLIAAARPACVIYDCINERVAGGETELPVRLRDGALLERAALVLTGGPSAFNARRSRHPFVYCIPGAVDAGHFAPRHLLPHSDQHLLAEALHDSLRRPRLGYFGLIDERVDLDLVTRLADAHPDWSVVMVGPVLGPASASLPRRANLHWLGPQPYARLPYLLAGWDLCLIPFAINGSTRLINPAQTLEYLAGGKPVVSTPLPDVVSLYGEAVTVAAATGPFVRACEQLLAENASAQCRRALATLTTVSTQSWHRNADTVHLLIVSALGRARAAHEPAARLDAGWSAAGA